ncbi:alpha/beta hydrolase [Rothia uropygialis]|uniref:alpha/beta hydrolase n=1 Tax=Kocuria sp. 36 TaxID=1415402 RepID=UPI001931101A|nr:alpha/beta hydrolase [Kocuria sp. 36]
MADFLASFPGFPGVDANRIAALGICGGSGDTLNAVKSEKRFKSVATVSMFNFGLVRRRGLQDSLVDIIQDRLRQASQASTDGAIGETTVTYAGDADLTDEQIAAQPFPLYRQGYVYYWKTHACPGSSFKYTMASLFDLMRFDATDQLELIDVPLLMIAGSTADTRYMSDNALEKATGTDDKELFLLDGAQHVQTYWVDQSVDQAIEKLTEFYARTV